MDVRDLWPSFNRKAESWRYLLGQLNAREQARFERRYLRDDRLFEQLEAGELELIEAYARGHLSEDIRRKFEKNYLVSDRRRRKISEIGGLIEYASKVPVGSQALAERPRRESSRVAWATCVALSAAVVCTIAVWTHRSHSDWEALRPDRSLQPADRAGQKSQIIAFILGSPTRGLAHGGNSDTPNLLRLPLDNRTVQLSVFPENLAYRSYQVRLLLGSKLILRKSVSLNANGELKIIRNSSAMPNGVYYVFVSGIPDHGDLSNPERFAFEVARR